MTSWEDLSPDEFWARVREEKAAKKALRSKLHSLLKLGPIARDAGPFSKDNWRRLVTIGGLEFRVGVYRGSARRAMYGKKGYLWHGWLQIPGERVRWSARVEKNIGALGIVLGAYLDGELPELAPLLEASEPSA